MADANWFSGRLQDKQQPSSWWNLSTATSAAAATKYIDE
jgi:hypothetical protein